MTFIWPMNVLKSIWPVSNLDFNTKTKKKGGEKEKTVAFCYFISIVDCEKRFKGKKIKFLWKSAASGARVMQLEQDLAFCKYESQQRVKREM